MNNPSDAQRRFSLLVAAGFAAQVGLVISYAKYQAGKATLVVSLAIAVILWLAMAYYALVKREYFSVLGKMIGPATGVDTGNWAVFKGLLDMVLVGVVALLAIRLLG